MNLEQNAKMWDMVFKGLNKPKKKEVKTAMGRVWKVEEKEDVMWHGYKTDAEWVEKTGRK